LKVAYAFVATPARYALERRRWSEAAAMSGDRAMAKAFYVKLVSACERADGNRPELQEAEAFLAKK
jgi:hypothetical protein